MKLRCLDCRREWPLDPRRWRCPCGEVLEIAGAPSLLPALVDERNYTLWRYREALPLSAGATPITLGEGWTPLIEAEWSAHSVRFKIESLNPTGSFKDRGAALLVTALRAAGIREVVEDSSGNAGAALAAYAARAGLAATVFVPTHASPVKQAQIGAYGAQLVAVSGTRSDTGDAVLDAVDEGAVYATHAYSPFYPHGMKTVAFELWEQCGWSAPGDVVVPVGHGSLLLGLCMGFEELLSAGAIEKHPRLFGVQARACAPLARAWERGTVDVESVREGETVASGVRIAAPPWGRHVLRAVRETDGAIIAVSDEETLSAQEELARRGFYVEPTSALPVAGLKPLGERLGNSPVVVVTGSGFKNPPQCR